MKLSQIFQIKILRKINKINIDEEHLYVALTLITGAVSGLMAIGIHKTTTWLTNFFGTNQAFDTEAIIWSGCAIFISGYITTRLSSWSSGSGIPQVKIALVTHHGVIKFKDLLAKLVTSILSLSSGFSVGREGPTTAICAGIGSNLGRFFSLSKNKIKGLVAIGCAGGIAAAFNTPIAAVIFTLEEIVGDISTKRLGPIVIASVIASVVAASLHGNTAFLGEFEYKLINNKELLFYVLIGLVCAIIAPIWVRSIIAFRSIEVKIFKTHKLTVMMVAFIIIVLVSQFNDLVLGSGNEVVKQTLLNKITSIEMLATLLFLKMALTALCYSTGVSGGVFLPTLFAGSMIGAIIGKVAHTYFPDFTAVQGAYALVGMGAFFAAVIRAPFTSILIIFEMTRNYEIILPLMVANILAYLVASKIESASIYELLSEQDGVHLPTKEDDDVLDTLYVEDAMMRDVKTLNYNLTIKEAIKIVNHSEISGYPVMRNNLIYGVLSTNELGAALAKYQGGCTLDQICQKDIVSIYPDQSLLAAFHKLKKFKISRLLVVSRINESRLIGIITAEDIVKKFGFHIQEESKADVIDQYLAQSETPSKTK